LKSHFPFASGAVVAFMAQQYEQFPMEPEQRHAIDRGNAETLFARLRG